mgnify:CR=1 FL=1
MNKHFLDITANNCKKTFDKRRAIHYNGLAMRDWRNRQTRTFKGRVGDRVSSSLTSRTNKKSDTSVSLFFVGASLSVFSRQATTSVVDVRRSSMSAIHGGIFGCFCRNISHAYPYNDLATLSGVAFFVGAQPNVDE